MTIDVALPASRRGVRNDEPSAGRLLRPPEVLRARPDGRLCEGIDLTERVLSEENRLRRRNWLAMALATLAMLFSCFPYTAAFADSEGESGTIDMALVGMGLVVAPFVFVLLAFVSGSKLAPKRVMQSMVSLPLVGLGVGLLSGRRGDRCFWRRSGTMCEPT